MALFLLLNPSQVLPGSVLFIGKAIAMWQMLQQEMQDDYVIATGKSHSLREFVELAVKFEELVKTMVKADVERLSKGNS
ncbi:MAG: GDP-mannose 4,6-dehydratase [Candidatus Methanoperedens sp.]|nr:GDP-mannose 4,6-dehydratase [Candidatus Methanoperedens sp.]